MLRILAILGAMATPAGAHEFWLDPLEYQVANGGMVEAHLRNGEMFKGSAMSYLPRNFQRFDLMQGPDTRPVPGRAGDMPAVRFQAEKEGLMTLVHVTKDTVLTYREWEKFASFVTHKDARWVLDAHDARGLPRVPVRERYSRYVRSLIAIGEGQGQDRAAGMEVEIMALDNPYVTDPEQGVLVQVLYQAEPRAMAQIELFERSPDSEVTVTVIRTDAEGKARLPVRAGHAYLADHVVLREIIPETEGGAVWESLWGALTFAVPE